MDYEEEKKKKKEEEEEEEGEKKRIVDQLLHSEQWSMTRGSARPVPREYTTLTDFSLFLSLSLSLAFLSCKIDRLYMYIYIYIYIYIYVRNTRYLVPTVTICVVCFIVAFVYYTYSA